MRIEHLTPDIPERVDHTISKEKNVQNRLTFILDALKEFKTLHDDYRKGQQPFGIAFNIELKEAIDRVLDEGQKEIYNMDFRWLERRKAIANNPLLASESIIDRKYRLLWTGQLAKLREIDDEVEHLKMFEQMENTINLRMGILPAPQLPDLNPALSLAREPKKISNNITNLVKQVYGVAFYWPGAKIKYQDKPFNISVQLASTLVKCGINVNEIELLWIQAYKLPLISDKDLSLFFRTTHAGRFNLKSAIQALKYQFPCSRSPLFATIRKKNWEFIKASFKAQRNDLIYSTKKFKDEVEAFIAHD